MAVKTNSRRETGFSMDAAVKERRKREFYEARRDEVGAELLKALLQRGSAVLDLHSTVFSGNKQKWSMHASALLKAVKGQGVRFEWNRDWQEREKLIIGRVASA